MYDVCVAYLQSRRDGVDCVLLGEKRRGLGNGKVVAPGGKLEPGEGPRHAAVREIREETGLELEPEQLSLAAVIAYEFPTKQSWSQRSFVFTARDIEGDPSDSAELAAWWCPLDEVPYERMWSDAVTWVPGVLQGKRGIRRNISFGPDLATVATNDLVSGEIVNDEDDRHG